LRPTLKQSFDHFLIGVNFYYAGEYRNDDCFIYRPLYRCGTSARPNSGLLQFPYTLGLRASVCPLLYRLSPVQSVNHDSIYGPSEAGFDDPLKRALETYLLKQHGPLLTLSGTSGLHEENSNHAWPGGPRPPVLSFGHRRGRAIPTQSEQDFR